WPSRPQPRTRPAGRVRSRVSSSISGRIDRSLAGARGSGTGCRRMPDAEDQSHDKLRRCGKMNVHENIETAYVDSYMVFTPAGQARMAACRFTQQEHAKVEAAAHEGILLIADATITRALASSKGSSTPPRRTFSNARPSPGVRLAYLFRRSCERDGRPI